MTKHPKRRGLFRALEGFFGRNLKALRSKVERLVGGEKSLELPLQGCSVSWWLVGKALVAVESRSRPL